ncbi:hypothetical protein SLT67_25455 [Paenibacillus illinoisensis]
MKKLQAAGQRFFRIDSVPSTASVLFGRFQTFQSTAWGEGVRK